MDNIRLKVLKKINGELGNDVNNLVKCRKMYEDAVAKEILLKQSLSSVKSETPSKVVEAKEIIENVRQKLKHCEGAINTTLDQIAVRLHDSQELYLVLKSDLGKIRQLKSAYCYLKILNTVKQLSKTIHGYILGRERNIDRAIDEYQRLCKMCLELKGSSCQRLTFFLEQMTKYWQRILHNEISNEFAAAMKTVMWPIVSSNNLLNAPTPDAFNKFQIGIRRLLQIQLPEELQDYPDTSSTLVISFPEISIPIVELIKPLRKRFLYHFTGQRQTNRLDKPEWYFTQILTWIRDHENFLKDWIQPIYEEMNYKKVATSEFMCGLVKLSIEKLQCDIEQVQFDDALFSHTVDEALGYDRELRMSYDYPAALPGPLQVLTQAQLFVKWIHMERKYARDKMDAMMKSESAWSILAGATDEDKVTEVAHTFLALLATMTDRYSLLPQPGHRLQFVELELELIDDLRVSLLQVLHSERLDPINSNFPQILNTVSHLRAAIEQYDASPTILLLDHYKKQYHSLEEGSLQKSDENERGGLFKDTLLLLERLEKQLLGELCEALMMEVKARSRPYRKDKWFAMTEEDLDTSMVSLSACNMFQALADNLHLIHTKLSKGLFISYWKLVAKTLTSFLLEELILENHFNSIGGQVLEKDISKFLLPVFHFYIQTSQSYFYPIKEAAALLGLEEVSESTKQAIITGNTKELLKEVGHLAGHMNPEQISAVLKKRMDIALAIM